MKTRWKVLIGGVLLVFAIGFIVVQQIGQQTAETEIEGMDFTSVKDGQYEGAQHYQPSTGRISLNIESLRSSPTGPYTTFFHEAAHLYDDQLGGDDSLRNTQIDGVSLDDTISIEKIFSLFDETNFSNWSSFKAEEDVYNNWKYGIETKDGKVFSNMVENLPENDQGWKLFTELFGFATHYPVMKK